MVVTHDRFFMRCLVEGQNPARLRKRPGIEDYDDEEEEDEESKADDEDGPKKRGIVYRLFKGQLKVLEHGMEEYEGICERASARMLKARAA